MFNYRSFGTHFLTSSPYLIEVHIDRRSVCSDPKANVNACDDFITLVVTSHFLVACMKMLGMSELDGCPQVSKFDESSWMMTKLDRKALLYSFCREVILAHVNITISEEGRFVEAKNVDNIQAYAEEVMTLGIFYLNYKDAIREGDGSRVLTTWKYLLPIFRFSNRRNYSLELLQALYNYYYVLSPRQASQFLWSRCVNTRGIPGKNKPADLHIEHLNRSAKECISGLGSNKTPKAISRIGKAIGPLNEVLENFDDSVITQKQSGRHKIASSERDQRMVINELILNAKVFDESLGRFHSYFPKFRPIFS